jgi:hypothetical protein
MDTARVIFATGLVAIAVFTGACRCGIDGNTPGSTGVRAPTPELAAPADVVLRPTGTVGIPRRMIPGISQRTLEVLQQTADAGTP